MYARSIALALLALPFIASAAVLPRGIENSCNSGPVQCCNSVQSAQDNEASFLLSFLHIDVSQITGQVGVTCSPITAIGVAGNSCSSQTVCCDNNTFKGVVALGCTPINLNL